MKEKLTQKRLKEVLYYNPDTGIFICLADYRKSYKKNDLAGHKGKNGYMVFPIDGKTYLMHRLAFLYMEGYFPENQVDHIDRNKSNNKWDNLREVSATCNSRNCNISKKNKSGVTGVYWIKSTKKWFSCIGVNNKNITLGFFDDLTDAVKARWNAEIKYGYPDCCSFSSAYLYLKKYGYI